MALSDDITNLPASPASGASSHLTNHSVIHAALKAHEARANATDTNLANKADLIGGRVDPAQLIGTGATGTGIRVDTTVGTRVFVGTTMIYGDTGWASYTVDDMTAGQILMRRVNHTVFVQMEGCVFSNATGTLTLPRISVIGMRPSHRVRGAWVIGTNGGVGGTINIASGGYFNVYGASPDTEVYASFSYPSQPGWPDSLVGPPV